MSMVTSTLNSDIMSSNISQVSAFTMTNSSCIQPQHANETMVVAAQETNQMRSRYHGLLQSTQNFMTGSMQRHLKQYHQNNRTVNKHISSDQHQVYLNRQEGGLHDEEQKETQKREEVSFLFPGARQHQSATTMTSSAATQEQHHTLSIPRRLPTCTTLQEYGEEASNLLERDQNQHHCLDSVDNANNV